MQEDEEDADGTDKAHAEQIEIEEASAQGALIGQLIVQYVTIDIPSQKQTGEESANGEEELSCGEIKQIEQ